MTDDYLKSARTSKTTSEFTEPELIATREEFAEIFEEMTRLRAKINAEKLEACASIDAKYKEELKEKESQYSMLLSLTF